MDKFEYQILTGRDRMDDWRRGHVVRDVQHGRWSRISGRSSSAGPPRVAPIDKLSLPLTILLRPRGSASRCPAWRLVSGFMTMGALLTIG